MPSFEKSMLVHFFPIFPSISQSQNILMYIWTLTLCKDVDIIHGDFLKLDTKDPKFSKVCMYTVLHCQLVPATMLMVSCYIEQSFFLLFFLYATKRICSTYFVVFFILLLQYKYKIIIWCLPIYQAHVEKVFNMCMLNAASSFICFFNYLICKSSYKVFNNCSWLLRGLV